MSNGDITADANKLLAGFDFAQAAERAKDAHRQELERLLCGMLEVIDSLDALEQAGGADSRTQTVS